MKVLITSGGSQMLLQIATLEYIGVSTDEFDVYYTGLYPERVGLIIAEYAHLFGMRYKGYVSVPREAGRITGSDVGKLRTYRRILGPKSYFMQNAVELFGRDFNDPCEILSIPLRHKVPEDALFISLLNPKEVVLTADGLVDKLQKRNLNTWRWIGVRTVLNKLPVDQRVYTPSYLKKDVGKIGLPQVIPSDIIERGLCIAREAPASKELINMVLKGGMPKSILFMQHLALMNVCTELEEILFYSEVIRDLIDRGEYPIVIKPHPRDPSNKIHVLREIVDEYKDKVVIVDNELAAVPMEVLFKKLQKWEVTFATSSSSAPLSLTGSRTELVTYDSIRLSESFRQEIKRFSRTHGGRQRLLTGSE